LSQSDGVTGWLERANALSQPRAGYRFGPENLLLPDLLLDAPHRAPSTLIDLGAGCGILGLLGAMTTGALLERRDGASCHPLVSNLVLYTVGLAATLPVAWALEEMRVVWSANLAWGLGYLVLVNSLISMTLLLAMLRAGEAARVSALFFLVPPLAALLGWVVLGREVAPLAWLGTAIVALGVILARRGAAR
jgi:drug/metabolite transporter (DMT)-like permease